MMTLKQAFTAWEEEIKPVVIDDIPALSESWNDYTDSLCKDGELTDLQYHYYPAYDESMPDNDRAYVLDQLGVTMKSEFVPFSRSRNADNKDLSLNWKCTVSRGRQSLTVDYTQGIGHLPKRFQLPAMGRPSVDQWKKAKDICETGRHAIPPDREDVLYSLLLDAEAIDYDDFEDWADSMGFGTDSRRAESIYKACLDTALKLRGMLGDSVINDLRELFNDY